MTNTEVEIYDVVLIEVGSRTEAMHEAVRELLDEYQAAGPAPRLSVDDMGVEPLSREHPFLFRIRVRNEDALDLTFALTEGVPGILFRFERG